jgi:hypothetical protein
MVNAARVSEEAVYWINHRVGVRHRVVVLRDHRNALVIEYALARNEILERAVRDIASFANALGANHHRYNR